MRVMNGLTRRRFLLLAAASAAGLAGGRRASAAAGAPARFATQPGWDPPSLLVDHSAEGVAAGHLFVAPFPFGESTAPPPGTSGPLILDDDGEVIWFLPLRSVRAQNFRVQRYHGKPVLTWYEGSATGTYGGSCVIYDDSYREVKRVHSGHGLACDLHEFLITSRGTGLMSIYNEVSTDLTAVGGPRNGRVVEGIVQELEIETGKVLLEWHSLDYVPVTESYRTDLTPAGNVDYFHLNSIGIDVDGDLLVSSRHTSTVYKLDRRTGAVRWRLGGKNSDFSFGPGAAFNFQHDVRSHADGTLTLFDNGATDLTTGDVEPASRPLRLRLDPVGRTAELVQVYSPPQPRLAFALGDVQELALGAVFVGWGTAGAVSEFAPDGTLRFDATFAGGAATYRAFRFPWHGHPRGRPAAAATRNADGSATVRVSWNGATEVVRWQVRSGARRDRLAVVASSPRRGFETTIELPRAGRYVAVAALDRRGRTLGSSATIPV